MIDRRIDQAIASLLGRIPGLIVFVGAEDIEPPLETPWCVVYSAIDGVTGRKAVYKVLVTIEYNSISGQDAIAGVDSVMQQIDDLIGPGSNYSSSPGIVTTGLRYLGWESINRTRQDVGDRRKNVRELVAFAELT